MKPNNDYSVKFKMLCHKDAISKTLDKITGEITEIDPEIPDLDFCLEIAAREILANAIEHGCENSEQEIEIELQVNVSRVKLAVKDPGKGFEPENVNLNDMPIWEEKGRGLAMVNEVADGISFNETGNKVTVNFRN